MIGQTLGHYRIVEKIGEGGMGVVYRAHDDQLDRDVALKVLPEDALGDERSRARLLREARSAAALNHPHICTIYEVGEAEGQAYIAMEFVDGQPLARLIPAGGFPVERVLRYGLQIADAVAHAHGRGVVHRDLKSANVVITPESRAKVLDFGLAKRVSGNELAEATTQSLVSVSQPGALVGTLPYMAPEQLRGQPADARSDVWALGVVFYELAAGARPFTGDTGFEVSAAILSQPLPPLPAKVPVELRAVIEQCLAKAPAARYQQGSEVQAALEAIHAGTVLASWAAWKYVLSRRRLLAGAGVAGALSVMLGTLVGLNVGGLRDELFGGPAAGRIESIAVLPLDNLSGDPEEEYFVDGMTEALTTSLGQLAELKVISRTSAMTYKNTNKSLQEIAAELGVDGIVEGTVAREGDRVRVSVQLIHAAKGHALWSQSYERELTDILSIQGQVASAVAQEIDVALTPEQIRLLSSGRPVNVETYEAYLRGMFRIHQGRFEEGLRHLREAVDRDPADAHAYAGLALGYASWGHGPGPPGDAFPLARAAAQRALELDTDLADAHLALADASLYYDWDWPAAGRAFQRALALNPNSAEAHYHHGWYLGLVGTSNEAVGELRRASELDPLTSTYSAWVGGWDVCCTVRLLDGPLEDLRRTADRYPEFPLTWSLLGLAHAAQGRFDEALAAHERAIELDQGERLLLGQTLALLGRREEARQVAVRAEAAGAPAFFVSLVHALLGDKDEAFRLLEVARDERYWAFPWFGRLRNLASLRGDPRFDDLLMTLDLASHPNAGS